MMEIRVDLLDRPTRLIVGGFDQIHGHKSTNKSTNYVDLMVEKLTPGLNSVARNGFDGGFAL